MFWNDPGSPVLAAYCMHLKLWTWWQLTSHALYYNLPYCLVYLQDATGLVNENFNRCNGGWIGLYKTRSWSTITQKINHRDSNAIFFKDRSLCFIERIHYPSVWFNRTCRTCHRPLNLPLVLLVQRQQPLRQLQQPQQQELLQQMH